MIARYKIDEIKAIFNHHQRKYIYFTLFEWKFQFLYVLSDDLQIYSLFFGEHFESLLPKLKDNQNIDCIECKLGMYIKGGISYDSGDLVEFNLDIDDANQIVDQLRKITELNGTKIKSF